MKIFRVIKDWFFPPLEYKGSVKELVEYLPVGDLDVLCLWVEKWIPYVKDSDTKGLDNYNGADLTIKAKYGDCESKAAVFVEVISHWKNWAAGHIWFSFNHNGIYKAHDVCWYITPKGTRGWIEVAPKVGGIDEMRQYYKFIGWDIISTYCVNDIGEKVEINYYDTRH